MFELGTMNPFCMSIIHQLNQIESLCERDEVFIKVPGTEEFLEALEEYRNKVTAFVKDG
jgi:hypothetical protein